VLLTQETYNVSAKSCQWGHCNVLGITHQYIRGEDNAINQTGN